MIHFFRDILSGPLYIITSILSIIFIMAIIGFMMERKKLEDEKKAQVAIIDNKMPKPETSAEPTPIQPVLVENHQEEQPPVTLASQPLNNITTANNDLEVQEPVIIFEDPEQKKE